jgi:hypothetical protein
VSKEQYNAQYVFLQRSRTLPTGTRTCTVHGVGMDFTAESRKCFSSRTVDDAEVRDQARGTVKVLLVLGAIDLFFTKMANQNNQPTILQVLVLTKSFFI